MFFGWRMVLFMALYLWRLKIEVSETSISDCRIFHTLQKKMRTYHHYLYLQRIILCTIKASICLFFRSFWIKLFARQCLQAVRISSFLWSNFTKFELNTEIWRVRPIFSANTGKWGPEKTSWDSFRAV